MRLRERIAAWIGRGRREDGFAVPTTLLMLAAAFGVASVAVIASVQAQQGSNRDQRSKEALAAAEAGVSQALLHYNRIPTVPAAPCLVQTAGTTTAAATQTSGSETGWCQQVTGAVGDATFAYSVRPVGAELEIVSRGTSDGVSRRIEVVGDSSSGRRIFNEASVLAQDAITLDSESTIESNMMTNGSVSLLSNAKICGDASYGVGEGIVLDGNSQHLGMGCVSTGNAIEEPLNLPPVNQGDAATNNDNDRFFTLDVLSGDPNSWTPETRTMRLRQNSSLTMGGEIYSFCRLEMDSNTSLFIAPGSNVTIYFDSPEACGLDEDDIQLDMRSNSVISGVGGGPVNLSMLFVGSRDIPTNILFNSNTQANDVCEQNFVLYAPLSNITVNSNSQFCGAIGGKTIHLDSEAYIQASSQSSSFELPNTAKHFVTTAFRECKSTATGAPDAGC
jgi:hypothetical protein